MSLSGNLRTMPFADLLQFVSSNQSTGTLQVRSQQVVKRILFEKGKIISSSSSDPRDYLGHFLVSQGLIIEEDLRIAMEVQRSSKMLLGKILVMSGKIPEQEMVRLLKLKTEETVFTLFLWNEGEFTFYHDEFINRLYVRIALDPQALIFEGVMRRDEWERIRQVFPSNHVILKRTAQAPETLESENLQAKMIYGLVDEKRTIEDIALAAHCLEYPASRILFQLYDAGYLIVAQILASPPGTREIAGGDHSTTQMLNLGRELLQKKQFEEALDILREIKPSAENYQTHVIPLIEIAEKETVREIYLRYVRPDQVLRVQVTLDRVSTLELTPQEGFVLSRMDGSWDVNSILSITPMKEVDVLRVIKKLMNRGIIGMK